MLEHYGLMSVHTGERLSLRKVDVAARISGILATTTLTQCYENSTDTNLELSYTFPLPVGGILLAFTVRMGERTYVGEVISRQAADVAYEAAIEDGDSAFRLQEIEPGLFNVTLGNVLAGESVAIELTFTELLTRQGTFIRYQLPTTIAPRYGAPRGMQPWQRPETSVVAEYRGSKPKPQKFPSSQIKVSHERVQVDHLAIALEGVMPVEQDVPPSCR